MRLLDETAILACAAYVDLNPIRAALAKTLEQSDFTSAQKRIQDVHSRLSAKSSSENSNEKVAVAVPASRSARHLAPVDLQERSGETGPCVHKRGQRCSNKGFLPMSAADYLNLLDGTARQVRSDKRGATPQHLAPLFDRLGCRRRCGAIL